MFELAKLYRDSGDLATADDRATQGLVSSQRVGDRYYVPRTLTVVADPFVTDRAFEDFCKKYGHELKASLIDPPIAKWLVEEYGASELATRAGIVSRAQKHALVVRACHCGRKIAGNAYFRHLRSCQSMAEARVAQKSKQVRLSMSLGARCSGMSG